MIYPLIIETSVDISPEALVIKYQQKSQKWKYATFIDVA